MPLLELAARAWRQARRRSLVLLPLVLAAAGCTTDPARAPGPQALTGPIAVAQQDARVHRQPPPIVPQVISLCYSNLLNTAEQVETMAAESCSSGRLEFYGEDALLTSCPLLQPVRATYLCHKS